MVGMNPKNEPETEVIGDTALACHEKLAFPTRQLAEAAAAVDAYRFVSNLKAYKCRYCTAWHLSSH